ncbi:MAG: bacteriohemerythrin [Desulfuromonadaceae bacterium]|nr:bacteriohemerythrin [Desulfuromonadaceae bacterium]MDD5107074.1 bacteriohemerythrin [Desulfuromonadaceae bacterium]
MSFFEWNKNFELGIEQFDEHHRHLVDLLNEAYDNFICKADHETLGAIIDKLFDYATYHFTLEEQWMALNGYEGLTQHREEHAGFSRRIIEIQNDFCNGRTHVLLEVLTFLKNWLSDHILVTDASYGRFAAKLRNV